MRDDGARFALVAFPAATVNGMPIIIDITEDAVPAAVARNWIVLGRDSQMFAESTTSPAQSNPRRRPDEERERE